MSVQIRLATSRDYQAVAPISTESQDLHVAAHPGIFRQHTPGLSAEDFSHMIEDKTFAIYVAELAEQIVGYVFTQVYQASYLDVFLPKTVAVITDIAVIHTARGQGIGTLLFETALKQAKAWHAERLELTAWEFNTKAIALYERLGMSTLSRTMSLHL